MNKEEIMKEIEHIANCELYDTIGVKYLRLNIEKLFEENQQLKERIEYLERSNNRREDTIIEQRQRLSDLEDNWNKNKERIDKAICYVQENTCWELRTSKLLDILKEDS